MTAIDGVRYECVGCGSNRIKTVSGTEQCMDCLERGVEMFGAPQQLSNLAKMLVYAVSKGSEPAKEIESLRADLMAVANRLVILSRDAESVGYRLAKAVVCEL